MPFQLDPFADIHLDEAALTHAIDEHTCTRARRFDQLWNYYRNPLRPASARHTPRPASTGNRWYRQAQDHALPPRIIGPFADPSNAARREIVIENDIAWRLHTMIDFMLGRPVVIASTAQDESLRTVINHVLDAVWESSGGVSLLQDIALLGHVFGHADVLVRPDDTFFSAPIDPSLPPLQRALDAASHLAIEPVEPRRGVPIIDPFDYRAIRALIIHTAGDPPRDRPSWPTTLDQLPHGAANGSLLRRTDRAMHPQHPHHRPAFTEIISANASQQYHGTRLVRELPSITPGELPVVHIQNLAQPFAYEGLSEVEPLIPIQDELNTRLSDRACRVTMQSFKMFFAKGIDGFAKGPIGPGVIWSTDNPDASIETFGGDAASPSEENHIQELREALDKISGVPPLAGGVVRARIGNLSSANALRITLMALLGKTARKRVSYGRGIARICRLVLTALHNKGALLSRPEDRNVRLEWPDPLPPDTRELLYAAEAKARLGVPRERILEELGYAPTDPGVQ